MFLPTPHRLDRAMARCHWRVNKVHARRRNFRMCLSLICHTDPGIGMLANWWHGRIDKTTEDDRMKQAFTAATLLGVLMLAVPASAKEAKPKGPPPALFIALTACRGLTDPVARLACFDAASAKLDAAVASNEVVVVDKMQVEQTKRGLFGLQLPNFRLFGSDNDTPLAQIDSTVTGVRGTAAGWLISLADGSTWQQMDDAALALSPKAGMAVIVKSAALGSYKMNIAKQPAIRVKRIL